MSFASPKSFANDAFMSKYPSINVNVIKIEGVIKFYIIPENTV